MRKLRFTRSWRGYRAGQVVDVAGGLAQQLIAQGVVIEEKQQQLIETAAVEPVAERADATPRRAKRAVPQPRSSDAASR